MLSLNDLQQEMRTAFLDGAVGMLVSASVWLAAAVVSIYSELNTAIWTLLTAGMLIHPISLLVLKVLGKSTTVSKGSPLIHLSMATTAWLIVGCILAFGLFTVKPTWFFPAMLLVIGSRYLAFQMLFGHRIYWICGATLMIAGYFCVALKFTPTISAFTGSGLEAVFATILLMKKKSPLSYIQ